MTEQELLNRFAEEKPVFGAFGRFVVDAVQSRLDTIPSDHNILLIQPQCRLKDEKSLVEKAFYRKKQYSNPYEDITDKVGVRFVVLDHGDIKKIETIIESLPQIVFSKDRDFEEERLREPTVFVYQSVHYIVRPRISFEALGIEIPQGTPCEVQIRTILQHAYSEITHDTIYKPSAPTTPKIKRLVARSMALIETTDEIFNSVKKEMNDFGKTLDNLTIQIIAKFSELGLVFDYEPKIGHLIHTSLHDAIGSIEFSDIQTFFEEKRFLIDRIRERSSSFLYRQPSIVLLYYLARNHGAYLLEHWPIEEKYLYDIFSDLGISMEH